MAYKGWDFKKETGMGLVGKFRFRIADVESKESQSGNDMIVVTLDISGQKFKLKHYITFMPDKPEMTNRMLTQFFESFGIDYDDFNFANWLGKVGGGMTKVDDNGYTKISYFIHKDKQGDIPAWQEPDRPKEVAGFQEAQDDDDIPF